MKDINVLFCMKAKQIFEIPRKNIYTHKFKTLQTVTNNFMFKS